MSTLLEPPPSAPISSGNVGRTLHAVEGAVIDFGRFRKRWVVLHAVSFAVIALLGGLLLWFLLDWAFKLPAWPLLILFVLALGGGTAAAVHRLIRPLRQRVEVEREALVIETLHGGLDNQIIGSLQLGREVRDSEGSDRPRGYAVDYVVALLDQARNQIEELRLPALVDLTQTRRLLAGACAVLLAILLIVLLAPSAVGQRFHRLRDAYATVMDTLFPVELRVAPGDVAVVRGRPVTLSLEAVGARRTEVMLYRTDLQTKKSEATPLILQGQKAAFELPQAGQSFSYEFEYGGRRTPSHRVLVDDLPEISAINYELAPPAYTGQLARTLTGRLPRVAGLAGTNALVSFAATTDLHPDLCYVEWADGSRQTLSVTGRFAHFGFTLAKPDRAVIHLTGALGKGFEMANPVSFELVVQPDAAPTVRVTLKNRQLTMLAEEAANFAVDWISEDDYGVAEINLSYRIDTVDALLGRPTRDGTIPRRIEPARDLVKGRFADMFKTLDPPLQPGDRITITLTARDNNTETGPGVGKSLPVEIVVVRPDLTGFVEKQFGFGTPSLLDGLKKVKRTTDLLVEPDKTVRTEKAQAVDKQALKVRPNQEPWPGGTGDAAADYFNLLSGGNK